MNLIEKIEELGGFLTGSRAWGCERPDSDHDYVLDRDKKPDLEKYCKSHKIKKRTGGSFKAPYYKIGSEKINVIFLSPEHARAWKIAGEWMRVLSRSKKFKPALFSKKRRVLLFETMYNIAREMLEAR